MKRLRRQCLLFGGFLVALHAFSACAYESGFDVQCDSEGQIDGDRECVDGVWVTTNSTSPGDMGGSDTSGGDDVDVPGEDTGTPGEDMAMPPEDMSMPDMADMDQCTAESNEDFCMRLGVNCGEVTDLDNCMDMRTVTCGTCTDPETCGGAGVENVCGCTAETDTDFCERLVKDCEMVSAPDNCGDDRTVDCGSCMAPAECGGGGTPNVCGCPGESDVDFCNTNMAECGSLTAEDSCMQMRTTDCGACPGIEMCGSDAPNECACPDDAAVCTAIGAECGMVDVSTQCDNKTNGMVDCGGCQTNASCGSDNLCACDSGFVFDPLTNCVDVDECADQTDNCDDNATCTNNDGGFSCTCNAGYSGDGTTCSPVDYCDPNPCDPNAACTVNGMMPECTCNAGWTGDGMSCADIDECATNMDDCDPIATCTNEDGGFTCACPAGYDDTNGDGTVCTNIDECAGTNNCDANATCMDTPGDYTCMCNAGYTGDGFTCVPTIVTSVETVEHTFQANGNTSATVPLSNAINPDNAVVFVSKRTSDGSQLKRYTVDAYLSGANEVTIERFASNDAVVVVVTVVEFNPAEVAVQKSSWSGTGIQSFNAVDQSKSFIVFTARIDDSGNDDEDEMISVRFASNNEVTFDRVGNRGSISGNFAIVEAINDAFSVQHIQPVLANGDTSSTDGIASVNLSESFLLTSWTAANNSADAEVGHVSCELSAADEVTCSRDGTGDEVRPQVQIVEVPGATVQRGTANFASGDTNVGESIGAVTNAVPNLGVIGAVGAAQCSQTGGGDVPESYFTAQINGTRLDIDRAVGANTSATVTWEVIEWP